MPTTIQALGRVIVTSQCDDPISLWSIRGSTSAQSTFPTDTSYSECFTYDLVSGGRALKINPVEGGIFKPNGSQNPFAYASTAIRSGAI
ncbi:hypothetical protein EJ02DRAFT_452939 [Clathrospora elynae]|uniref:Uncharacterized protein n=1 Tax=Clathrospora elynae TaxID=706981 RepID=A0A6A5SVG8_9PLEO|nr:hypothetical protein EJ02DRAFT_452939 [Clathrospora elynae]